MKLVIDISEILYDELCDGVEHADICGIGVGTVARAIANGTPLPKGHGRLIDAYDMKDIEFINKGDYNSTRTIREWIDSAPTIIEADKE